MKKPQVHLWLHEKHKMYYLPQNSRPSYGTGMPVPYNPRPFVLPLGINTRSEIKIYFQTTYDLTLSIRPPHKKLTIDGQPVVYVNAQILLGTPRFATIKK